MDTSLTNSFYYFFSAVPQVLGGILALFGVFVVFKVQSLKSQLLGIGQAVILESDNHPNIKSIIDNEFKGDTKLKIRALVEKTDIIGLSKVMSAVTNNHFLILKENYIKLMTILKKIIRATISASIITAGVILFALIVIPFGCFFLNHTKLLIFLFVLIILATGFCLFLFIRILIKSFHDINN